MKRDTVINIIAAVLLIIITAAFLFPIYWTFQLSVKPPQLCLTNPPTFFFQPTLDHYVYIFVDPGKNTMNLISGIIESSVATLLAFFLGYPASYAFSRFNFKGRASLMFWYLSLLLAPPVIFTIPHYMLMTALNLRGTYASVIILFQTFAIPLSIWLMKSFIDGIPREIDEAALLDGSGWGRLLFTIILPLAAPGVAVSMAFTFIFCWNNLIFPLIMTEGPTKPLSLATFEYFTVTGATWNYIGVCAFITTIPPLILFLILRRYIVRGLTFGAIKA